ncbi:MAG: 50S ribosomal protein L25 [bacterium]|nr:50S ribosomal protein L25 [bacterium]
MEKIVIKADKRDIVGKRNKILRKEGKIPAIVYGHGFESSKIAIDLKKFIHIFNEAGQSKIISLEIGTGKPLEVLIHEVQEHPTTTKPLHVDFYRIKMDEKIKASVPLHFIGETKAVFEKGGSFITNIEEIEVETLPANLPSKIDVDISVLNDFDKAIHVSDLKLPEGVELLEELEELVAKVEPPRTDEEMAKLEEEVVEEIPTEEGEVIEGEAVEGEGEEKPSKEGETQETSQSTGKAETTSEVDKKENKDKKKE